MYNMAVFAFENDINIDCDMLNYNITYDIICTCNIHILKGCPDW